MVQHTPGQWIVQRGNDAVLICQSCYDEINTGDTATEVGDDVLHTACAKII